MNIRKIQLILIDSLIIFTVFLGINVFALFQPDSILVCEDMSFVKFFLLYLCIMAVRYVMRIYNNIWRYANVNVYLRMMSADAIGGLIFIIIGRLHWTLNLGVGYSLLLIMTIMIMTLASRFIYQVLYARKSKMDDTARAIADGEQNYKIHVAIVGAGNIGVMLAEEFLRNPLSHYTPVCFIDTDPHKQGKLVEGLKVYPETIDVIEQIRRMNVQEIVIALPDMDSDNKKKLYDFYKQTNCKVKLYDYMISNDPKSKRTLREFKIEDLLFRESITVASEKAKAYYGGKTVLVTGGGGSIGSELCRQIAAQGPKKLVIVDIYENNAYDIQQELLRHYPGQLDLQVEIASVRDQRRMEDIFCSIRPEIVFHAAAHKHVPLMEHSGVEALKNNVIGTYQVANLAEKYGVEKFLLISTDKAVNPTNIMGATKRLCEIILQCREDSKTVFSAVRFGNVLGSNGSVIPLFRKQIDAGGPVTLTDKKIIRYFMTIPEAVSLVMETCVMAKNGELFILDMGQPVKILDLAENMIRLSGLEPYKDIKIIETGLRPGEKLYEELLMKNEELEKTENDLIFIERDTRLERSEVDAKLDVLRQAIDKGTNEAVVNAIRETVPTYRQPDEVNRKAREYMQKKAAAVNE